MTNKYRLSHLLFTVLSISLLGCKGQSGKSSSSKTTFKSPIEVVKEREQKSMEKNYSGIGELISTFEFKVKTNDIKDFKDGYIPWADLEKPENDLLNLDKRDEIIITDSEIKVIIDYPLTNQYEFILQSKIGFSRGQLLSEISKHYYLLYEEEERTATIKTIPIGKRTTMYNRNETNGKYGIWGHDIADIDLSKISIYKNTKGKIVVTLSIES